MNCLFCSALLLLAVGVPIRAQQMCGIAKDYVVQAREKARPGLSRDEMEQQRQQLKRASGLCPSLGDAYYYRSLFSRRLGLNDEADYALRKAKENGSEALAS